MKITAEEFLEIIRNLSEPANAITRKAQQFEEVNRLYQEAMTQIKTLHAMLEEVEIQHKTEIAALQSDTLLIEAIRNIPLQTALGKTPDGSCWWYDKNGDVSYGATIEEALENAKEKE